MTCLQFKHKTEHCDKQLPRQSLDYHCFHLNMESDTNLKCNCDHTKNNGEKKYKQEIRAGPEGNHWTKPLNGLNHLSSFLKYCL